MNHAELGLILDFSISCLYHSQQIHFSQPHKLICKMGIAMWVKWHNTCKCVAIHITCHDEHWLIKIKTLKKYLALNK